jgi:hypothetical protein
MKSFNPICCEHRGIRFEVTSDHEHSYWRIEDGPFHRTSWMGQTQDEVMAREAIREARDYIDAHFGEKERVFAAAAGVAS